MRCNQETGRIGEDIAVDYLNKIKYKIVERNFQCKQGEIDIIAMDKKELVFIEVKTRKSNLFGEPAEAVTLKKQKHICKATEFYLYSRNLESNFVRIDVIEIFLKEKTYIINHIKTAIS